MESIAEDQLLMKMSKEQYAGHKEHQRTASWNNYVAKRVAEANVKGEELPPGWASAPPPPPYPPPPPIPEDKVGYMGMFYDKPGFCGMACDRVWCMGKARCGRKRGHRGAHCCNRNHKQVAVKVKAEILHSKQAKFMELAVANNVTKENMLQASVSGWGPADLCPGGCADMLCRRRCRKPPHGPQERCDCMRGDHLPVVTCGPLQHGRVTECHAADSCSGLCIEWACHHGCSLRPRHEGPCVCWKHPVGAAEDDEGVEFVFVEGEIDGGGDFAMKATVEANCSSSEVAMKATATLGPEDHCNGVCIDNSQECKSVCQTIKNPPSPDEP